MTYTHVGRYGGFKSPGTLTKGIMAGIRKQKRVEAEARNANTPVYRTSQFRRQSQEVQHQWLVKAGILPEDSQEFGTKVRSMPGKDINGNSQDILVSVSTPDTVFAVLARNS
jgi:hypothetical protein